MTAEVINAATLALKKALIERALGAEMNHHLGYPPGSAKRTGVTNQRNGKGATTVLTEDGPILIEVPRGREGSFEPLLFSSTNDASRALTTRSWLCTCGA